MLKRILTAAVIMTVLVSCGKKGNGEKEIIDGVAVYKNSNLPSDRSLSISTERLFTLNEDTGDTTAVIRNISSIDVNGEGQIFILDRRRGMVFKFGAEGSYISSFGKRGTGPGELAGPGEVICVKDTVYVTDQRQRKIVVFNSRGEYIRDIIPLRDNGFPQSVAGISDGIFAGTLFGRGGRGGPGPRIIKINFSILDQKFEKTAEMFSKEFEMDMNTFNPMDHEIKFASDGGMIYQAENTEDKIQVNVFDGSGKKLSEIRKSYARVLYTDEEKKQLEEQFGGRRWREVDFSGLRYKKSVENVFYHPDGYLLLETARKTEDGKQFSFVLDIFRDGVYLNSADLNEDPGFYYNPDGFRKLMKKDMLFVYNEDDNIISVYRLKITQ